MHDELFTVDGLVSAHARVTDPISSELTVASLGRDTSYRRLVLEAVFNNLDNERVTDDDVLDYIERTTERRHQRNVIARTRGLLEREGWLERGPMVTRADGRTVISYDFTSQALNAFLRAHVHDNALHLEITLYNQPKETP
jgi:hypothetical protein